MSNPIDVHVGAAVAAARIARGLTQSDLGQAIGVTFQQVQKYERGANRLSASRLLATCRFLGIPVASVFPEEGDEPVLLTGQDQAFGRRMGELAVSLSTSQKALLLDLAGQLQSTAD